MYFELPPGHSSTGLLPILGGIVIAIIGAIAGVGSWLVARRKTSGRIDTTEADTLWAQAESMRKELRGDLDAVRRELDACKAELAVAKTTIQQQTDRLALQAEHIGQLRDDLTVALREVSKQNTTTQNDVHALKRELALVTSIGRDTA